MCGCEDTHCKLWICLIVIGKARHAWFRLLQWFTWEYSVTNAELVFWQLGGVLGTTDGTIRLVGFLLYNLFGSRVVVRYISLTHTCATPPITLVPNTVLFPHIIIPPVVVVVGTGRECSPCGFPMLYDRTFSSLYGVTIPKRSLIGHHTQTKDDSLLNNSLWKRKVENNHVV